MLWMAFTVMVATLGTTIRLSNGPVRHSFSWCLEVVSRQFLRARLLHSNFSPMRANSFDGLLERQCSSQMYCFCFRTLVFCCHMSQVTEPAPATGPCPCQRPLGETEGYRGCPVHPQTTPCQLNTEGPVYGVFCLLCFLKKHRSLRCFGPFGGHGFHLGDVKKHRFLRGFGLQPGRGKEKLAS